MASPPRSRRGPDPFAAAEAVFKPAKPKAAPPAADKPAVPSGRETVSLRIDRTVLEHFQADGPGWQDRINEALRELVAGKS
ncbi:BrnA antitoxin family protein [Chelatococcus reniformis]|uniref:BrnA antitoxin family protein n=1 Tax=Chelatococcus reniformis TaxID=1494448 RepID=A0A916XH54_9HYPH|nr:BrnA antitoxin family protein [Chelatococcus reniformis]GGC70106.1 hypothetical protein GCM10010994_30840 [Chelatococcus reniformis]